MITAEELQQLLGCMCVSGGHTNQNGNYVQLSLECNFCSQDDYLFAENFANSDFEGVAERFLTHMTKYHPSQIQPPIKPVTDEEVAEVFGVAPRRTRKIS